MNKPQIKNFSVWARRKLIETVSYRMSLIGITEKGIAEALPQSTADLKFYDIGTATPAEVKGKDIIYRNELAAKVNENGFNNTVEEIAYTWFNRLIAIRFMEVNDYLPSGVRILSSAEPYKDKLEPDILTYPGDAGDYFSLTTEENELLTAYKMADYIGDFNDIADKLFKMYLIKQCNKLGTVFPGLFETKSDYTEYVLNVSYTDKDGIIYHLVHDIPEDDFNINKIDENTGNSVGQVEIIGWLYQYYNTEPKDAVFAALKKNVKITKENIPAATQLFTPDWIVRYMVENSLGRIYSEKWSVGSDELKEKMGWKYYLPEAEQEPEVAEKLAAMREELSSDRNPEEIKFIDPCMGSGHILVYAFDVLMQIYASCGYSERDAAQLIIQKNLYGLEIDQRAYQLAYFALMMKARQYDRRFFNRGIKPNIGHFQNFSRVVNAGVDGALKELAEQFINCDTYGSLTPISEIEGLDEALDDFNGVFDMDLSVLERMMTIYKILSQKYDVVCTNPPYMGGSGMSAKLSEFVKDNYPDSKSDLFAVFIERCGELAKKNGYYAMITQHAFMFLSSYEKLRAKLMHKTTINMAHLGARAFDEIGGEVVQTTAFVNRNSHINDYKGTYARLVDIAGENEKKELFLSGNNRHTAKQENFSKIPGSPVAYWVSENFIRAFENGCCLGEVCEARKGLATSDNNRFLKFWFEVAINNICFTCSSNEECNTLEQKWYPHNKGGEYNRWYGNNEYVINWYHDGFEIRNYRDSSGKLLSRPQNTNYNFKNSLTWSKITSGTFSARYCDGGYLFDDAAAICYNEDKIVLKYVLGFLNSSIAQFMLDILNPTLNKQISDMGNLAILINKEKEQIVSEMVDINITLSKTDWDSFETSWDFKRHPLLNYGISLYSGLGDCENMPDSVIGVEKTDTSFKLEEKGVPKAYRLKSAFEIWSDACDERFNKLKQNEEELNRIFIDIYGLQDELTPEVEDKDVTVRKADLQREIKSLISYAVGCMFGRYSLNVDGLAYAGGEWDDSKYTTFVPDKDNCLIITDELYFNNEDIVSRFCEFIKVVYGEETLEENLNFIADALGNKGKTSREVIRNYFLSDFIKDHIKTYQKRPIYWLFDSGKQNGFKALVYMHRWNADTIGNVRVEYLHKVQKVYQSEIDRMQDTIENSTDGREVTAATKAKEKLAKQLKETRDYDISMAHLANMRINIDLDDGVKVNYEKVQTSTEGKNLGVLAKI
ncbi:MAG: BREX-1 system adenine-specific DNA-methyltransferase PglX [Oscillospiraceae bacterium]|nr:BREX-1 system adenine-specific DNA-methyltransferase PglX [Oscillospiraceae bacterium]